MNELHKGNEDGNIFEIGDRVSVETQNREWFSPSGAGNPSFKLNNLIPHKRKMTFRDIKEKKTMPQFKHEEEKYKYKIS